MDFLGTEPEIDLDAPSAWDDISVTVGHWGYLGKVSDPTLGDTAAIRRLGLDLKLRFRNLELWGGGMAGFDRDLVMDRYTPSVTWFGEASYGVTSWFIPVYLFQYQDSSTFELWDARHDLGAVFLLLENARARVKYSYSDDGVNNEAAELHLLIAF
jgi:hypothetical protein